MQKVTFRDKCCIHYQMFKGIMLSFENDFILVVNVF